MYNEKPSKFYKTAKALLNNKIFKNELELVLVTRELQLTLTPAGKNLERFEIATVLLKSNDGKYYKVQFQNDRSDIVKWKTEKQYVVKEVDGLDIREIGSWKGTNYYGNTVMAMYQYYRPTGKGKHTIKLSLENNAVYLGNYGYIEMSKWTIGMGTWGLTDKNKDRRKMKVADLEKMADERGLERRYIGTFVL